MSMTYTFGLCTTSHGCNLVYDYLFISDIYFQLMIIMVSLSVFATVAVINLSSRSQEPVPKWMKWIVFEKLPYLLFLNGFVKVARANISDSKSTTYENHSVVNAQRSYGSSFPGVFDGFNNDPYPKNGIHDHGGNNDDNKQDKERFAKDWYLIGLIVSRFFALFFSLMVILSTVIILFYIWYQSTKDFDKAVGQTKDEWLAQTFFSDSTDV